MITSAPNLFPTQRFLLFTIDLQKYDGWGYLVHVGHILANLPPAVINRIVDCEILN